MKLTSAGTADANAGLSQGLKAAAQNLCALSAKEFANPYASPFAASQWPPAQSLDVESEWFMSPELISIYGLDAYGRLSEKERMKLSFFEAVNFFSLNIHGEKSLVEGLAERLYRGDMAEFSRYLHHFLDEENKHMIYFGEFCRRYAGKIYPDRKLAFARQFEDGEENFLFFVRVMIFEELVDAYNRRMADDASLNRLARDINRWHHRDETRHLAFGRRLVAELFQRYAPCWSREALNDVRTYLASYLRTTWKEYYNPLVYKDAALENAYELQKDALASERCLAHRRNISKRLIGFLLRNEILVQEPVI